jgi:hypothetical protein
MRIMAIKTTRAEESETKHGKKRDDYYHICKQMQMIMSRWHNVLYPGMDKKEKEAYEAILGTTYAWIDSIGNLVLSRAGSWLRMDPTWSDKDRHDVQQKVAKYAIGRMKRYKRST